MKRSLYLFFLCQFLVTIAVAQQALIFQASDYYKKNEFEKAFNAYEQYYSDTTRGKSNYDTYYAAVSACKIGKLAEAKKYLAFAIHAGFHYSSYQELLNDPRNSCIREFEDWKKLMAGLKLKNDSAEVILSPIRKNLFDTALRVNSSSITDGSFERSLRNSKKPAANIKTFEDFPTPKKTGYWTLYTIKVDTLEVPFLLYIPRGYNGSTRYPLNVFLHGAVSGKSIFYLDAATTVNNQDVILRKQLEQNSFIIWPFAKGDFNWLKHQKTFEAVLQEVTKVKSLYNIDDNRVYLGGHSDGGAGAFWFALNKPSTFAGIFSLNYFPRVVTGANTPLSNFNNQTPFYGISGIDDTGMPLAYINPIYDLAKQNGANWTNYAIKGGHSLPYNMPDSLNFLYEKLFKINRDPFPKKIIWQTDDIRNGRNAWIAITALDTLAAKADWQMEMNPTVVTKDGKPVMLNYNIHKSGAVIATAEGNKINIQTSRVKKIALYISADMFDLKQQLHITINGKQFINLKVAVDNKVTVNEFMNTGDRTFLVGNKLELSIN